MRRTNNTLTAQIEASTRKSTEEDAPKDKYNPEDLVSTGLTLLNLAMADLVCGGLMKGKMVNIIGDSSSGKTLLALTICAELAHNGSMGGHRIIYDDVEAANEFNVGRLFGKTTESRIEAPAYDPKTKEPIYSDTIQDFQRHIHSHLIVGSPFIYILDSFDALSCDEEQEKLNKKLNAKDPSKVAGSYGAEKPKISSQILRMIIRDLMQTESILIIISQTRDNLNPMSFDKKIRSGGRALKFYATHEMWLAVTEKIKKNERVIGTNVLAKITKNKLTGKVRQINFPVYYEYGVDNIGSCIDFMLDEGYWKKERAIIRAEDLGIEGERSDLIRHIETQNLEPELYSAVGKAWKDIEHKLALNRKRKYQ